MDDSGTNITYMSKENKVNQEKKHKTKKINMTKKTRQKIRQEKTQDKK
jgi:hypothetical protein